MITRKYSFMCYFSKLEYIDHDTKHSKNKLPRNAGKIIENVVYVDYLLAWQVFVLFVGCLRYLVMMWR